MAKSALITSGCCIAKREVGEVGLGYSSPVPVGLSRRLGRCTRAGEPEDFRVTQTSPLPNRIADGRCAAEDFSLVPLLTHEPPFHSFRTRIEGTSPPYGFLALRA